MCVPAKGSRYHYLPSTSLELNVRAITWPCDSPLNQVLSLCSHMQHAHWESTVYRYIHTHTYLQAWHITQEWDIPFGQTARQQRYLTYHKLITDIITSYPTTNNATMDQPPQVQTHTLISILLFELFLLHLVHKTVPRTDDTPLSIVLPFTWEHAYG